MTEPDRNSFLDRIRPKTGKAARPAPSELDSLGNKREKPKLEKKAMTVWLPPEVIQQFKVIAAEEGVKIEELMAESMNRTFEKYGKPQIA